MSSPARRLRRARERQQTAIAPSIVAYDTETFASPQDALLAAARVQGCTCQPDIKTDGIRAAVLHDDHCALLRRGDIN